MKPDLPSCPSGSGWITRIDSAWMKKLWRCVAWAMDNPTGDGITIIKKEGGKLSLMRRGRSAAGGFTYNGPFAITQEKELINVSPGYLLRNSELVEVPEKKGIKPEKGDLCVCSDIVSGKWTEPEIKVAKPANNAFPIAKITVDEKSGAVTVEPYFVAVAINLVAKKCPRVEGENGG